MVAQQADVQTDQHNPFEHVAGWIERDLGDREHLADLDQAGDLLALLRRQHARQRRLHLIHGVVVGVVADIDAEGLGELARTGIGTHVETEDDHAGGPGQVNVGLADRADGGMDDVSTRTSSVGGELLQRLHQGACSNPARRP